MQFPQWIVDRVVSRQGTLHPFDTLSASKLAFVVVDMQNYFLLPEYQGYVPAAESIIPAINALCGAIRSKGGTVVWIQTNAEGADQVLSLMHDEAMTPDRKARRLRELHRTSHGYLLHANLDAHPLDLRVDKISYSAMVQGSSNLPSILRQREIDTLLIGGTVTNVCCESTARDAMMQNFRSIMVDDVLSAFSVEEHVQALHGWMLYFGDVLSSAEVIARLKR